LEHATLPISAAASSLSSHDPPKFSRLTALLLVAPSLPAAEAITSVPDEMLAPIDQGGERAWGPRIVVLGNDFFGVKNDVFGQVRVISFDV
jgi:hypothetical protein